MATKTSKQTKSRPKPAPAQPEQLNEPVTKSVVDAPATDEVAAPALGWLTVEMLLYGLIILLGITLRLWDLSAYPLSDVEARQALVSLALYQGATPEVAGSYSPLLTTLNTFLFFLLTDSDTTVRLATVLLGSALILLPYTFRRQLGRSVCLLATLLLAISPSALFLSRTLNSEIAVALGGLMLVAGFFNWATNGKPGWLYLGVAGLAILLTGGPMSITLLIIFAIIVGIRWSAFKGMWQQALALDEADQSEKSDGADEDKGIPASLRNAAIFLVVALVLLATAGTLNLGGFGQTTSQLTEWLSRFSLQPRADAAFNSVFLLTIYEPLFVLAGFVGLAYAVLSGNLLKHVFAGWFLGVLALDLVMSGRPAGSVILSLAPLVFLVAIAVAELLYGLRRWGSWSNEGIILASGLVVFSFAYIGLTAWLSRPCATDDMFCQYAWLQALAAITLFFVIVGFFWVMNGPGVAIRGAALTALVLGIITTVNIGWRLNYGPLMYLPYQPLAGVPASTELLSLSNTLSNESILRSRDSNMLDIAAVGPQSPALLWQLRNYSNLKQAPSAINLESPSAIITVPTEENEFNLGEAYLGQDFALNALWSPVGMSPKELINWLIYREIEELPQNNKVILWLKVNG